MAPVCAEVKFHVRLEPLSRSVRRRRRGAGDRTRGVPAWSEALAWGAAYRAAAALRLRRISWRSASVSPPAMPGTWALPIAHARQARSGSQSCWQTPRAMAWSARDAPPVQALGGRYRPDAQAAPGSRGTGVGRVAISGGLRRTAAAARAWARAAWFFFHARQAA